MNENDTIISDEVTDTSSLLEEYEKEAVARKTDASSVQLVICLFISAALLVLHFSYPQLAEGIIDIVRELSADENELIPNPLDMLISLIDKL